MASHAVGPPQCCIQQGGGLEWLWDASHKTRTGPVAYAVAALARAGVSGNWKRWTGAFGSLDEPTSQPRE
eukprot:2455996-Heterocapsa_arctica.AAC.1